MNNSTESFDQNIISDNQIGNQVKEKSQRLSGAQKQKNEEQGCRGKNANECYPLFFIHLNASVRKSEENLALTFYFFAILKDNRHDRGRNCSFFEFYDHFECHEIDGSVFDTGGSACSFFHFIGTVGTVYIDLIGLFHEDSSFRNLCVDQSIKRLFNC